MAIWRKEAGKWLQPPWHAEPHPGRVVIYGSGQSLHTAPTIPGSTRLVLNFAHRVIPPDIWIGLDRVEIFDAALLLSPVVKVFKGGRQNETYQGQPAHALPGAHFADVAVGNRIDIFAPASLETKFLWAKNTLTLGIQLALHMGYRHISFAGVDLRGPYFDQDCQDRSKPDKVRQLLEEEFQFMRWFKHACDHRGIETFNLSPGSRLAKIFPAQEQDRNH